MPGGREVSKSRPRPSFCGECLPVLCLTFELPSPALILAPLLAHVPLFPSASGTSLLTVTLLDFALLCLHNLCDLRCNLLVAMACSGYRSILEPPHLTTRATLGSQTAFTVRGSLDVALKLKTGQVVKWN